MSKKLKRPAGNSLITSYLDKSKGSGESTSTDSVSSAVPSVNSSSTGPSVNSSSATKFYKSYVVEKVGNCAPCSIEQIELQAKLNTSLKKLEATERAIECCLDIGRYKDKKIAQLQSEIQLTSKNQIQPSQSVPKNDPFNKFEGKFTEKQISELRSIKPVKSSDSTFVLKGVRFLYESNLSSLAKKSVRGKAKGKEPVTPEKLNFVKSMFRERLVSIGIDSTERQERAKLFNQHFHNAIVNINRRPQNIDRDLVNDINITYSEK